MRQRCTIYEPSILIYIIYDLIPVVKKIKSKIIKRANKIPNQLNLAQQIGIISKPVVRLDMHADGVEAKRGLETYEFRNLVSLHD